MTATQTFVFLKYVVAQSMHGAPQEKKFDFEWRKHRGTKFDFTGAILKQCKLTFAHHQTDLVTTILLPSWLQHSQMCETPTVTPP